MLVASAAAFLASLRGWVFVASAAGASALI
jgi:hypothetical protein